MFEDFFDSFGGDDGDGPEGQIDVYDNSGFEELPPEIDDWDNSRMQELPPDVAPDYANYGGPNYGGDVDYEFPDYEAPIDPDLIGPYVEPVPLPRPLPGPDPGPDPIVEGEDPPYALIAAGVVAAFGLGTLLWKRFR